jgi:XTP/dITP diphosphohydrolase
LHYCTGDCRFRDQLYRDLARLRATQEQGEHGFGYDPVFIPEGFECTAAALEPEVKNALSHRAMALEQLASYLAVAAGEL